MAKKRIMVVEDEGITAMTIKRTLEEMGFEVTATAASGMEAVEKATPENTDLVLMDITLEGDIDGIEASGRIRSRFNLPIVYLTAHSDAGMMDKVKKTEPFGYVLKPFSDHELRMAVEIALYKHEMELRLKESEIRFRTLFNQASDCILLLDPSGAEGSHIVDANDAACAMHGYKREELIGMPVHFLDAPDSSSRTTDRFRKLIAGEMVAFEIMHKRKNGELFPVDVSAQLVTIGEKSYILAIDRDITERKNAEAELRKHRNHLQELVESRTKELKDAYKQLSQEVTEKLNYQAEALRSAQLASIGELAAGVAHEINNPINGIINGAQILVNKIPSESKEHLMASMVLKEGNRIADIVGSLLSFARESKQPKGPVSVLDIMNDTLALTEAQIRKEMIKLNVKISAALPDVCAQPQQIEQVFLNIINNARYAMNKKYPLASDDKILSISGEWITVNDDPFIRITFYDTGVGIPPDDLGKVINPFFTTKPPKEGTGLGLSISHGIINDHGGALTLDSVVGKFTKVTIDLPVYNKS